MTDRPGLIQGAVTVYQPITVLDIAADGIRLEAGFALQNNSLHDFRLALGDRSVIVKGRVARCEIGELREGAVRYRCEVEFVDPAPHALAAIHDFVAAHHAPPPRVVDGEIADD
jgi:hypothetical protein